MQDKEATYEQDHREWASEQDEVTAFVNRATQAELDAAQRVLDLSKQLRAEIQAQKEGYR